MDVLGSMIMKRRPAMVATLAALLVLLPVVSPVSALDEPDRLFMVGERAMADRFYAVARRTLERFVAQFPSDARQPRALLMLGKARLALNDPESALEALRRAQGGLSVPGEVQDGKFWQAEALFRSTTRSCAPTPPARWRRRPSTASAGASSSSADSRPPRRRFASSSPRGPSTR